MDLQVVEIRYLDARWAPEETPEPEAYRARGLYAAAGWRAVHREPRLPDGERTGDRIADLGRVGGRIAEAVAEGAREGRKVLVVGGNCSHLPGVIGGLQQAYGPEVRVGLVWFDAHGDFNTPRTTHSGMLGGMPVAVSAGLCHAPWREGASQIAPLPTNRIVMVDVRNLDPEEEQLIRATDVTVARRGDDLAGAVRRLAAETDLIYLHVDLDVLDERLTPTHRTKEPGGMALDEALAAIETVLATGKVEALGLVAVFSAAPGGETTLASATALLEGALARWRAASEG